MVLYAAEHVQAKQLAYQLLAQAAALHWGLRPLPEIRRGEQGKPFFPDHPDCHFNISHSGPFLFCALDSGPVGVDVQQPRTCRPAFLDRVCGAKEREWLRRHGDSPEAFAQLWSLKESRCKQSGLGLRRPIAGISVPLPWDGEERLELDGLQFYLRSGPGWQMCLCGTGGWDGRITWLCI